MDVQEPESLDAFFEWLFLIGLKEPGIGWIKNSFLFKFKKLSRGLNNK